MNPGQIILRSAWECKGLEPNDLWLDIGPAWSGPDGFGSLPKGFITTSFGMLVDIESDITGVTNGRNISLGYGEGDDFVPIVTLFCDNMDELDSLLQLIVTAQDMLCSESVES